MKTEELQTIIQANTNEEGNINTEAVAKEVNNFANNIRDKAKNEVTTQYENKIKEMQTPKPKEVEKQPEVNDTLNSNIVILQKEVASIRQEQKQASVSNKLKKADVNPEMLDYAQFTVGNSDNIDEAIENLKANQPNIFKSNVPEVKVGVQTDSNDVGSVNGFTRYQEMKQKGLL